MKCYIVNRYPERLPAGRQEVEVILSEVEGFIIFARNKFNPWPFT